MLEFGSDQRLKSYETYGYYIGMGGRRSSTFPKNCKEAFWSRDELAEIERAHLTELERRAGTGDPKAKGEFAELAWRQASAQNQGSAAKRSLICRSAHAGHVAAQRSMGVHSLYPEEPEDQDLIQAYLWLRLATLGDGKGSVAGLAERMTQEQISEAERFVAEWQANPEECEIF